MVSNTTNNSAARETGQTESDPVLREWRVCFSKRIAALSHNELVDALHEHKLVPVGHYAAARWIESDRAGAEAALLESVLKLL